MHLIVNRIKLTIIMLGKLFVYYLIKLKYFLFKFLKNNYIFSQKSLNNKINLQLV